MKFALPARQVPINNAAIVNGRYGRVAVGLYSTTSSAAIEPEPLVQEQYSASRSLNEAPPGSGRTIV